MTPWLAPRLALAAAALLFSTGGAAIKLTSFSAWQVAGLRSGIAAITLWVLVPRVRTRGKQPWSSTLVIGAIYAATLISYVASNKNTTAANAIFLQSSAPLYVLLFGPRLLRERRRRWDGLLLVLLGAGLWLLLKGETEAQPTAPRPALGNALGVIAGALWAATLMGLRKAGGEAGGATRAACIGNAMAFLACLPFALPFALGSALDWVAILYLGVLQIGVAYVLLGYGIERVSAFDATLILMIEPAAGPIWAYLMHGETPNGSAILGGILILVASTVRSLKRAG